MSIQNLMTNFIRGVQFFIQEYIIEEKAEISVIGRVYFCFCVGMKNGNEMS